ncbi:MAG: YdiU family protein [Myxococcota bacterium]|nr:YdiU family protein [Myxococcota bacterium]
MSLRLDQLRLENTYAHLGEAFGTPVRPTPLPRPYPVAYNPDVARLLGLEEQPQDSAWVELVSGQASHPTGQSFAMVYAGHQFGVYVPRLGDGRAVLLGEARDASGTLWDLHLKGAGPTPYSRGGDGRAVLRSSIREYLACEALHALGIPTTRALCLVGSDLPLYREEVETAASLVRVAPTHVRFGTFEYLSHTQRHAELAQLADYVIQRCLPALAALPDADRPAALFEEAVSRTAELIAAWQAVGFCHGVLNTDNLSILGQTLDYGPYGFVEGFVPGFVPNHSDHRGRYALDQQPTIGLWNLTRLGEALLPLVPEPRLISLLETYPPRVEAAYLKRMRQKLGLTTAQEEDWSLVQDGLGVLAEQETDYTRFFRALGGQALDEAPLQAELHDPAAIRPWLQRYRARLAQEPLAPIERQRRMDAVNPRYVLRTHLAEEAIRAAADARDFSALERLHQVLRRPFEEQPGQARYAEAPPASARHLMLSCSS